MATKFQRTIVRFFKRWRRYIPVGLIVGISILLVGVTAYTNYMANRRLMVDPASYQPLLELIARVESKGNYNAYFGNVRNSSVDFTAMSIEDVLAWQAEYVRRGSASSAVGRYQMINTTLERLVRQKGIDTNRKFDRAMQDTLAIALLERRGAEEYVNNELTERQFAANLAKEWASLPRVVGANPDDSYYASDGLNKSLVSIDEVMTAIQPIGPK